MMRAPSFWWNARTGFRAHLLSPLGTIYGGVTARRMDGTGVNVGVPVVCIGNFVAGGAGKTPTAVAVAKLLIASGEAPVFLSRGYGGSLSSGTRPVRVDLSQHVAAQAGDEPLLLAQIAPTIIAGRKVAGGFAARDAGASVIVMDDGLQNASLLKDFALAVVDGAVGIGNGLAIPAGPLRAPFSTQIQHVDAVLVIGRGEAGGAVRHAAEVAGKAVFSATVSADPVVAARLSGRRVVAFAGIGQPSKFFATLADIGAHVVARRAFADHHLYRTHEIATLRRLATDREAMLVTTQKDIVRITESERRDLIALPVSLNFEDAAALKVLIDAKAFRRGVASKPSSR